MVFGLSAAAKEAMREDIERPYPSHAFVVDVLEMLRLQCEGHNEASQDFLREHSSNLLDTTFVVEVDHDVRIERLIRRHVRFGKTPDAARAWSLGPDERNALLIAETAARADHVIRLE